MVLSRFGLRGSCRGCLLMLFLFLSLIITTTRAQSTTTVCSGHGQLSTQGDCVCEDGFTLTNDSLGCSKDDLGQNSEDQEIHNHDHEGHDHAEHEEEEVGAIADQDHIEDDHSDTDDHNDHENEGHDHSDDDAEVAGSIVNHDHGEDVHSATDDHDDHDDHEHEHDHDHDHEVECNGYGHMHGDSCHCNAGYSSEDSNGTTCELSMEPEYFMSSLMAEYFNTTSMRIHVDGMDELISNLASATSVAADDKSCSGNGHWEGTECHCDSGFILSQDGRQCLAASRRRQTSDTTASPCLDSESLFALYNVDPIEGATESQFTANFSPAILQMIDSGACVLAADASANAAVDEPPTKSQAYLYAMCAVIIISLTSLGGVLIIPILLRAPQTAKWILMSLVALAVGVLLGDAILHLLPIALGVHVHADDGSLVVLSGNDIIYRTITVCAGMFFFVVIEASMDAAGLGHGHSHDVSPDDIMDLKDSSIDGTADLERGISNKQCQGHVECISDSDDNRSSNSNENAVKQVDEVDTTVQAIPVNKKTPASDIAVSIADRNFDKPPAPKSSKAGLSYPKFTGWRNVDNVAWYITVGDGIHNFVDGVSVGASFAISPSVGISTSVAVFLHELPQEFGDFGIYLTSGTGIKRALALNLASGFTGLLGVVLGIEAGQAWTPWILAFTAGMFIYIALVSMYPQLKGALMVENSRNISNLVQIISILIGWGIMLAIAFHESH